MNEDDKKSIAPEDADPSEEERSRRDFLRKAGRFAVVTPPTITLLLGTSLSSSAIAASSGTLPGFGGIRPGFGWGDKNHIHTGPPGRRR